MIIFASDSFKGSLSSKRISELLDYVCKKELGNIETKSFVVADGGEGTIDAIKSCIGGNIVDVEVLDPYFKKINSSYLLLENGVAVIEMAKASGLPLVQRMAPLYASSYGTGMLIKDALERNVKEIIITLGGSATNDGGMGALIALGVKFYSNNVLLEGTASDLIKIDRIDISEFDSRLKDIKVTIMSDVTNKLLGKEGATYTFARQKGAREDELLVLEEGMNNYSKIVNATLGKDETKTPGAGAAGGLGYGLLSFTNAKIKLGIEEVLDLIKFDDYLDEKSIVITGEGKMDYQSINGKVISGVAKRAKKHNNPCFAIVGSLGKDYENIYDVGLTSVITTVNKPMGIEEAITNAEKFYVDAATRLFRIIKLIYK